MVHIYSGVVSRKKPQCTFKPLGSFMDGQPQVLLAEGETDLALLRQSCIAVSLRVFFGTCNGSVHWALSCCSRTGTRTLGGEQKVLIASLCQSLQRRLGLLDTQASPNPGHQPYPNSTGEKRMESKGGRSLSGGVAFVEMGYSCLWGSLRGFS